MSNDLESIRQQKQDAQIELREIEARRVALLDWITELSAKEQALETQTGPKGKRTSRAGLRAERQKPENLPTIQDMATTVLRDRGDEFVEGRDIVAAIKGRWWPTATSNEILPSLARLASRDRLRKEGTRYALPVRKAMTAPMVRRI